MPRKSSVSAGSGQKSRRTPKAGKTKRQEEVDEPSPGADAAEQPNRGVPFPVVGIGASAGGFEAVMTLLKHMRADTGMAFVVVLHLDPRHKSKLTELVARATKMPTREIKDDMAVEPNHVFILPANLDVLLAGRKLRLVRRPESERLHMPIDHFLQSLAAEQGSRAIGVVLSGTGTDGTLGLVAIKAEGGITFAEAEASAKYFGMPGSAIDSGCVDTVMTPEAMGKELARIARHPFVRPARTRAGVPAAEFPESIDALGKIFFLLRQSSGVDFSRYKHTTLKRRISRRMVLQRIERVEDYVTLLRSNPEELDALFHDLLINVTGFFRDRQVYATLKKKILPKISKGKNGQGEIRVWVPGCATGEEVYSVAICLMEEITRVGHNLKLQIFGTDLSEVAIAKARTGIFPPSIAKDVSADRLRRFFRRVNGGYQISRVIRDMCTFARQNICEDPPFSRLDLISCRNVLIYLGPDLQKKCMPVFHYALNPGGYLLLGTSETIGSAADLFNLVDKRHKIYVRKATLSPGNLEFTAKGVAAIKPELLRAERPRPVVGAPVDLQAVVDRILLLHYTPSGVIVDRQLRVQEFRGQTGRYLEHAPGSASLNLLQMVRPGLIVDLRTAIHKALKDQSPVRKEGVVLKMDNAAQVLNLHVVPFTAPAANEVWLLILFEEAGHAFEAGERKSVRKGRGGRKGASAASEQEIVRLRTELDATKESLQAIIEEQEATNEELKSANEEIESSNEELQSTNEELETAKEELQSTNEELTTLNEELINRNTEMAQMNNDLSNLLSSINIPIIMVDNSLAVRRATPMAERLFNLIPTDIGRSLTDLKANLSINNLDQMIRGVIDSLSTREAKVQDHQGRWYSLRIRPYRTRDNKIDGAVITLVDVDEEQRAIARLELAIQYNEAILETVREPLLLLEGDLRVRKASRSFYAAFKATRKQVENLPLYELCNGAWNAPGLRRALEEILPRNKRIENFMFTHEIGGRGPRSWLLNARSLEHGGERLILILMEDITDAPRRQSLEAAAR
ncbi:MAG: chemotaxis protein CheB [Verrucomicrobiota bacterium]